MKKYLAILISILIFFLTLPVSVAADGWTEVTNASQIVNANANYKLMNDITLDANLNFGAVTVGIDLNGHTLYGPTNSYCMRIAGTTLTISDSSEGHTGRIVTQATNQNRSIFWLVGGVTSHVIINGGTYDGSSLTSVSAMGAMCRIETPSTFEINGGTFQNFTTTQNGAIFYVATPNNSALGASITVNGGTFTNNTAKDGTVFYFENGSVSTLTVNGGTFTSNTSTGTGGGVVYMHMNNKLYLNGGTFTNNTAARGGAILLHNSTVNFYLGGSPKVYGNSASTYGKDIFFANYSSGSCGTFQPSTIDLNSDAILYFSSNNEANDVVLGTLSNTNDVSNCFYDSRGNYGYRQVGSQILFGRLNDGNYYKPWTSDSTLPITTGYYFLTKDVNLTAHAVLAANAIVHLDLNGKTATQTTADTEIYRYWDDNASLFIEDYNPAGTVGMLTGCSGDSKANAIWMKAKTDTYNMYFTLKNGRISGITSSGNAIRAENGIAHITIDGGEVSNNSSLAIYLSSVNETNDNYFTMNGGAIKNNVTTNLNGAGLRADKGINHITINGGEFSYNSSKSGSAIYLTGNCQALIDGGTFSHNTSTGIGGAIFAGSSNTTLQIDSGRFESNNAGSLSGGGAIAVLDKANLTMNGGDIIENSAYNGGGIWIRKAFAIINDCNIRNNTANQGGGILAQGIDTPLQTSCLVLNDGYISGNHATTGGGIFIGGTSKVYLNAGTITGNSAQDGAGVYLGTLGYGILSDLNITNNIASSKGGGIFTIRGSRTSISDVSITGNSAVNAGGIFIDDDFNMSNITVTNNSASNGTGGIFVKSATYDGESYYSTIVKLDGNSTVFDNTGTHKNMFIDTNSIVNGTANGFSNNAKIGVEIADSNIKKTFVGKYSYDVNGNEYIITKGYQYRIVYHPNGATINGDYGTIIDGNYISGYDGGQTITLPTSLSKDESLFLGWYDNAEFTGNPITSISSSDTGNKEFYAKFENHHFHGSYTGGIDDDVEWIPWERSDSLPSYTSLGDQNAYFNKHYYLTCDVYLTQRQVIQRTVTIDLNGYSVYKAPNATFTGAMISVNGKWANPLTITNCKATFDEDGFLASTAGFHNSNATGTEGAVISASGDASKNEFPNVRLYGINFEGNSNIRTSNEEWIPGVIFWRANTTLTIESCAFRNNVSGSALDETSTYGSGGVIALKNIDGGSAAGTININKTLFDGNKAGNRGSAITIPSGAIGTLNISNSKFVNNKVVSSSASAGGVIATQDGSTNISNTSFTNNENAGNNASVIYAAGNASVSLNNVTITGNRNTHQYSTYRAAVSVIGTANLTVSGNTVVDDNTNSNNKEGNIFLRTSSVSPKITANSLGENASMGVDVVENLGVGDQYVVVEGKDVSDKFFADKASYIVKYSGDNTVLSLPCGIQNEEASLVIADNIDADISFDLDSNPNDYTVKYTFLGEEHTVEVTGQTVDIGIADIYSFQMTEPITVEVYYKGSLTDTIEYTVKDYCQTVIETSNDAKLVNLCKATLNYGAAAQTYFDGKTYNEGTYDTTSSGLANDGVETTLADSSQPANVQNRTGDLGGIVTNVKYTLVVGSEVSMKFYIYTNEDLDLSNLSVGCSPYKATTDVIKESAGKYSVKITGIKAAELGTDFNVTFIYGGQSMTITYSPYAFAASKWSAGNSLAELCKKLVTYGDKAIAYKQ